MQETSRIRTYGRPSKKRSSKAATSWVYFRLYDVEETMLVIVMAIHLIWTLPHVLHFFT